MPPMKNGKNATRAVISGSVSASAHDDGLVLLHRGIGRLFTANKTGAVIWRCLEQQMSIEDIASSVSKQSGITETMAREHTTQFLDELARQGLLEARP